MRTSKTGADDVHLSEEGKLRVTLAIFRARICVLALLAAIPVLLVAQQTRLKYPETRKVEWGYFGPPT